MMKSAARWVDQIVVVDTGSVDGTRDIARDLGATDRAVYWFELGLELGHDLGKHDPGLFQEAAGFYAATGQSDLMFARLAREEVVKWDVDFDQWELIADLYEVLGDGENPERGRAPVSAARAYRDAGDNDRASHWYSSALLRDPCELKAHFDDLLREAAELYSLIGVEAAGVAERALGRLGSSSCPG